MRVEIKPDMLRWARERAGFTLDDMAPIEKFAKATYTPVGFLFLAEPPVEQIPIPDFRTMGNTFAGQPSPHLLDTLYICQQRQEWYRDFIRGMGEDPLPFVGSARISHNIEATAAKIRHVLRFDLEERRRMSTWADALRRFIEQAEDLGILVMCSGVVLNNNKRKLDPEEFRGFAMADDLAPLVFINGADTKAAQMFTLAHELAHIWLGETALSDSSVAYVAEHDVERWCNRVAAELLVPLASLKEEYDESADLDAEVKRLARCFKVSTLVILRRIHDAGGLNEERFWREYRKELGRLMAIPRGSGGDFYLTQAARLSKRFARALVASTLEGQTLHRDAFRLLGFSKFATFQELGHSLGVA